MYTLLAIFAAVAAVYYGLVEDATNSILYLILGSVFIVISKLEQVIDGLNNGRR